MTVEMGKPLIERIKSKEAVIGVVGLGYVGLPLAIKLAEKGFSVKGIERKPAVIRALMAGKSFVPDVSDDDISNQLYKYKKFSLVKVEKEFRNTKDTLRQEIADCDVYIICVPTPLEHSSRCNPNIEYISQASEIVEYSIPISESKHKLVIIESTTYPGCTEETFLPIVESALSMHSARVELAYSPERTNPGGKVPFWEIPKIVGALNEISLRLASELYRPLFEDKIIEVTSIKIAETIKCAENAYRLLSISFANKMAQLLQHTEINIWDAVRIVNRNNVTLHTFFPKNILERNWPSEVEFFAEILRHNGLDGEILTAPTISINNIAKECANKIQSEGQDGTDQQLIVEMIVQSYCQLSVLFFHQLARFGNLQSIQVDIKELISGILTKPFGLNLCFPGPGAGGHCIPVDPLYLYWRATKEGLSLPLIWESYRIDEVMPDKIVRMIRESLYARGRRLGESSILVLGVTYKENVPDIRESKALDILRSLLSQNVNLCYCDPVFAERQSELFPNKDEWMDRELYLGIKDRGSQYTLEKTVRFYLKGLTVDECVKMIEGQEIHCVVIFTNHDDFSENRLYKRIISNQMVQVIDTRNVIEKELGQKPKNVFVLGRA